MGKSEPRVWEGYLTDQDKALLQRRPRRPVGTGSSPALLLIDNYRSAVGDRPLPLMEAVEEWPGATGLAAWAALECQRELLAACRASGVPAIHLTRMAEDGLPGWNTAVHAGEARGRLDLGGRRQGADDIVDQVAPLPGEPVIAKSAPSAFGGTPLAGLLSYLGVDTVLVVGEATSGCVRATVVDAASHRLRVVVVEECVYDRFEASHAINLFDMHQKYADVLPLAEVLGWLESRQRPARDCAVEAPPAVMASDRDGSSPEGAR